MRRRSAAERLDLIVRRADDSAAVVSWLAPGDAAPPSIERRRRPSDALFVEFLLQELRDANDRGAELEALMARAAWRLVS